MPGRGGQLQPGRGLFSVIHQGQVVRACLGAPMKKIAQQEFMAVLLLVPHKIH